MAGFSICERSEYAKICLDRNLHISWVLNMPAFWIWQGSEYGGVAKGYKYATICLNISEQDVNRPEYVWIYDNRQGSEYAS